MFTFYEMTARKENTYHDEGVVSRSASGQKKNGSGRFLRQRVSICNVEVYDYAASWKSEFWTMSDVLLACAYGIKATCLASGAVLVEMRRSCQRTNGKGGRIEPISPIWTTG